MEVMFIQDVKNVAKKGDTKKVADGFARNFLFPNKLALPMTQQNMRQIESEKKLLLKRFEREKKALKGLASKIEDMSVTFEMSIGESGKMFGSVTSSDIAEALKKQLPELRIEKESIVLKEAIKTVGAFTVEVILHSEVKAALKIWVIEKK